MDKLQNTDKDIFLERVETNTNIFYIDRQRNDINTYRKDNQLKIPNDIDYSLVGSLSNEAKEVLSRVKPESIAQASALPGITPAAIGAVIVYMRQKAA